MLRTKLKVLTSRPKELVPVEYEYTNGVVFPEHLHGKKLYYSPSHVTVLPSSEKLHFFLHTARKFNATNKLTGREIKVKGGKFYDSKDYALFRDANTYHHYTLRERPLLRYNDSDANRYLNTPRRRIPNYLISVQDVAGLDETVRFNLQFYGPNIDAWLHHNHEFEIFLNI